MTAATPAPRPISARLDEVLAALRAEGRVGLMAHMVFGYPTLEESRRIGEALVRAGADIIEVQLPFSDPTADGPTITAACHRALAAGARPAGALRLVADLVPRSRAAFLLMSYFNLAFNYRAADGGSGVVPFARDAAASGVSGLIVPDIPPEEEDDGYPQACRAAGVHPIYVISPNAGEGRLRAVARRAGGLVYSTSRTGTTGKDVEIRFGELGSFLARARAAIGLPIAVGFSISRREHVESLAGLADVAVVGSHLIRTHETGGVDALEREVRVLRG